MTLHIITGVLLVIGGCATTPGTTSALALDSVSPQLAQLNAVAGGGEDWLSSSKARLASFEERYRGELPPRLAAYLEKDIYLYEDPVLSGYLDSLVARLLEGFDGRVGPIKTVVVTDSRFNAYVDEIDQLHVSTGLLRDLENEDQLAAVLAHELAHVLLRHNDTAVRDAGVAGLIDGAEMVLGMSGAIGTRADDSRSTLGFAGLSFMWRDMLTPLRSREMERAADRLGLDLMMQAGMNYEEGFAVVDKIVEANVERSARLALISDSGRRPLEAYLESIVSGSGSEGVAALGETVQQYAAGYIDERVTDVAAASRSHDSRDVRLGYLSDYLTDAHGGGDLPPPSEEARFRQMLSGDGGGSDLQADLAAVNALVALAASDYQRAQKAEAALNQIENGGDTIGVALARSAIEAAARRYDEAIVALERLTEDPRAPANAYLKLAELQLERRRVDDANETLALGIRRIGRDYRFLPLQIRSARRQGDSERAADLAASCTKHDRTASTTHLLNMLDVEAKGKTPYYDRCVDALGYDVLARRRRATGDGSEQWLDKLQEIGDVLSRSLE